jgi:hypothetical protein
MDPYAYRAGHAAGRGFYKKEEVNMDKLLRMVGLVALSGILMMAGGCGGGGDETPVVTPTNPSVTASFTATINANGTATTGATATTAAAPPGTPGYLAGVSVTLPAGTIITAPTALTSPLSFTFTAPADSTATFSGINGVPIPTGINALTSTSGAVNVQLTGAASATFNPAITITMPVPGKAVGSVIKVYTVTGTTYTLINNPANALGWPVTTAGFVSFPVSSLSWKVGDPAPAPGGSTTTTTATTTVQPTTTTTTATTTVQPTTTTAVTTTITGSGGSGGGGGF